jgi:hypothetical protein
VAMPVGGRAQSLGVGGGAGRGGAAATGRLAPPERRILALRP